MLDAADTSRIIAVFDWEMATLGDPLTDIGYAVLWWGSSHRPGDHPSQIVADLPGFPGTGELVERYAEVTGRDCSAVSWYVALRSEEHTSELQSLMRISYDVFCLKKKQKK